MTKFIIVLFCSMLIVASLISLGVHEAEMAYIIGLSKLWIIGRLAFASFLLMYYMFFPLRRRHIALGLRLTGFGLLYAGISSVLFGSYGSGTFIPVVDIVLTLEGGIVAILASLELPQYEHASHDITALKLNVVNVMPASKDKLRTAH